MGLERKSTQLIKELELDFASDGKPPFVMLKIGAWPHQQRIQGWIHPTPDGPLKVMTYPDNPLVSSDG